MRKIVKLKIKLKILHILFTQIKISRSMDNK